MQWLASLVKHQAHLFDLDRAEQVSWLWLPNQTAPQICEVILQISYAAYAKPSKQCLLQYWAQLSSMAVQLPGLGCVQANGPDGHAVGSPS